MGARTLRAGADIHLTADQVRSAVAVPVRQATAEAVVAAVPDRAAELQSFVALLRQTHGALVAAVSIVTPDRQTYLAVDGLDTEYTEVRDEVSFCAHVVAGGQPLAVPDALHDPRFWDNPFVADRTIGSYVGVPLRDADGHVLGTLCLYSTEPGRFDASSIHVLAPQAGIVRLLLGAGRATAGSAHVVARSRPIGRWRTDLRRVLDLLARPRTGIRRWLPVGTALVPPSARAWCKRLVAIGYAALQAVPIALMLAIVVAAWVNQVKGPPAPTEMVISAPVRPGSDMASQAGAEVRGSATSPASELLVPAGLPDIGVRLPEVELSLPDLTVGLLDMGVIVSWDAGLPEALAAGGSQMNGLSARHTGGTSMNGLGAAIATVTLAGVAGSMARRRLHPGDDGDGDDGAVEPREPDPGGPTGPDADDVSGVALRADAPAALEAPPKEAPCDAGPVGDAFVPVGVPAKAPSDASSVDDPSIVAGIPAQPEAWPLEHPVVAGSDTPVWHAAPSGIGSVSREPLESTSAQDADTRSTVVYVDARQPHIPLETVHIVRSRRTGKVHR